MPASIRILSAGAVSPGLKKIAEAFEKSPIDLQLEFATAPEIRRRLGAAETVDIVIAPQGLLDEFDQSGIFHQGTRTVIGRIGAGIMVKSSAPAPKLTTVDEFRQALLNAGRVVYNQASTGQYFEALFQRLGIAAALSAKTTRYPDFAAVREHIRSGGNNEIGLGATTVIVESTGSDVKFVGPLPAEIQNYTSYSAALTARASTAARKFFEDLGSQRAQDILRSAGLE